MPAKKRIEVGDTVRYSGSDHGTITARVVQISADRSCCALVRNCVTYSAGSVFYPTIPLASLKLKAKGSLFAYPKTATKDYERWYNCFCLNTGTYNGWRNSIYRREKGLALLLVLGGTETVEHTYSEWAGLENKGRVSGLIVDELSIVARPSCYCLDISGNPRPLLYHLLDVLKQRFSGCSDKNYAQASWSDTVRDHTRPLNHTQIVMYFHALKPLHDAGTLKLT